MITLIRQTEIAKALTAEELIELDEVRTCFLGHAAIDNPDILGEAALIEYDNDPAHFFPVVDPAPAAFALQKAMNLGGQTGSKLNTIDARRSGLRAALRLSTHVAADAVDPHGYAKPHYGL